MKHLTKKTIILAVLSTVTLTFSCTQSEHIAGIHIVRGYFGLGDHENVVHITSSADFHMHIWARNVETSQGGVQIMTPPSHFRTSGSNWKYQIWRKLSFWWN